MAEAGANSRLEAFSDGVFAIALTLLVIDIRLESPDSIDSTPALWRALQHLVPTVFAFVLSFGIILITWVNHHATLRMVRKSCASFIYANGFLLLTVAFIPFPTGLLGAFIATDHAAPAVVLYNAALAVQGIGWILLTDTALRNHLASEERSMATLRENRRNGYFAVFFYSLLAATAVWFPVPVAIVTTASWIFWLVLGIRIRHV